LIIRSGNFSPMAKDPAARKAFAKSCAEFCTMYNFDGIDLDWEFPVENGLPSNARDPQDGVNYTLLCQDVRAELNALGATNNRQYLLTIAAPAGPDLVRHIEIAAMGQVLDFVNIMTYDYRGGWSKFTGHQTPLYDSSTDPDTSLGSTRLAIQLYLDGGMPPDKIVVGAAMYGRGFKGVPATNNGLFQPFQGVPMGTWDGTGGEGATGVFDYKDIVSKNMPRYWDDEVKAPWVFDPAADGGLMISYDDPQSIDEKVNFINSKGLGGMMFWELSGDIRAGTSGSLLDVSFNGLMGGSGIAVAPVPTLPAPPAPQPHPPVPNQQEPPAPQPQPPTPSQQGPPSQNIPQIPTAPPANPTPNTGQQTPTQPGTPSSGMGQNGTSLGTNGGSSATPGGTPSIAPGPVAPAPSSSGKRIVGYFIAWGIYGRGFKADMIPVEKLTHINYGRPITFVP